jgi:hypothetical protein
LIKCCLKKVLDYDLIDLLFPALVSIESILVVSADACVLISLVDHIKVQPLEMLCVLRDVDLLDLVKLLFRNTCEVQ